MQNLSYRSGAEPPATVLPKVILKLTKKWVSCLHAGKSQFCTKEFATLYGSAARVFFLHTVVDNSIQRRAREETTTKKKKHRIERSALCCFVKEHSLTTLTEIVVVVVVRGKERAEKRVARVRR